MAGTDKKRLRAELLARRAELSEEYLQGAGLSIQEKLLSSPLYKEARSLFVYVSMPGEPSTERILERAFADGKRVYVPKCIGREMLAVRIRVTEELLPGTHGIPEPGDAEETATAEDLDLIIVPCVAAAADGRRLGHGGGYYDRFLREERENAVCLCFRELLCEEIPAEAHDVRIKHIITE